ncbi:hypothetical protein LTR66_005515 [Elasticomyces elasticus]|nr:hypothetical protein LTR28_004534 [Elasticomyces elasticus]KAK4994469.1 hypothetical protein LTR66_005515 [Elasticomyces elasticus]
MSQKRKRTPSPQPRTSDIFVSEPIHDRQSTFTAYYSPTVPAKELQSHADIATASHRILAWRKPSTQQVIRAKLQASLAQKLYDVGHDDDGEKYAGKRVERVLETLQAEGALVVARWYGGVMLGPVRFSHIETCAKDAVERWKEHVEDGARKKRKAEEDELERLRLVKVLGERDQSIGVLRALAVEKEAMAVQSANEKAAGAGTIKASVAEDATVNWSQESTGGTTARNATTLEGRNRPAPLATPTKTIDYAVMALEQLARLEKARDATIGFLLKRIDKAEALAKQASSAGSESAVSGKEPS